MFPGADYLDFSFDGKPYCLCSDGAACEGAGVLSVDPELCLYRVAQGRARTFELGSGDELQLVCLSSVLSLIIVVMFLLSMLFKVECGFLLETLFLDAVFRYLY